MIKILIALTIGSAFGVIGSKVFFVGSALSLIPWAVIGLILGWGSEGKKEAVIKGIVYGFALSFTFMASGYTGTEPLISRFPFYALLGIVGAICGLTLGLTSYFVKTKLL